MTLPAHADVVVVGAGLAGLAAAVRLQESVVDAVLVEAGDAPGGRVRTDLVDGFRLDRGFQLLNPAYPEARRLLDLGALELRPFDAGLVVVTSDRRHTLGDPRRMPRTLRNDLTAPVGSMKEKVAFGTWVAGLGLAPPDTIRRSADRSVAEELAARGAGGALLDRVLRPFLSGVLAEEELASSQRMVSMLLRAFARGHPSVPARGMQALPDQLAARLRPGSLHLGVEARQVTGREVDTSEGRIRARAVVVATDAASASGLGLPGSPMRALTTWWYAVDEPPAPRPMLHVDAERRGPVAHTVVTTNAAPSYSPDHRALVAATAVGARPEGDADVRRHLALLYGTDVGRWELLRVDVVERALPAHPPGQPLQRRVALGDGLFVAGDHRDTPSIQGALVSGRRAADAVLATLGATASQ